MSPAPILGHIFRGRHMLELHWAHVQAAAFIAICGVVGAVLGLIYGMVRKGERDG